MHYTVHQQTDDNKKTKPYDVQYFKLLLRSTLVRQKRFIFAVASSELHQL